MIIKNTEIEVVQADITCLKVDAIVNAANNKLVMGGGVAGAIRKAGGKVIEEEAVSLGPIEIGQAIATKAGNLPCKFVIHAATMGLDFKTDEIKIRNAIKNTLRVAEELKISSIAIPALGSGVGKFPLLASAKIMSQEVFRLLREKSSCLKKITFCVLDSQAKDIFNKGVINYLGHLIEMSDNSAFITVDAIIELNKDEIVIVQRSNPPFGWALPGGFIDYGETLEQAVIREAKEETGLDIKDIKQLGTYSDPNRDPRFRTIGTVFIASAKGVPKAGDDAAALKVINLKEADKLEFAFDHKKIIQDYIKYKKNLH
ncbi:MAG: macro domain-containing protein [Candidatus Omnitrophota bacterium]